jgi:hypothetical protein
MKNTMSLVATCLFIPIRLPNLSFGVCFTCFAIFTSLLLYIILLAKQAFVYNQLIITPPIYNKTKSFCVGGGKLYRGCSLKPL